MAKVRFVTYKNSVLASIVSVLGTIWILVGILLIFEGPANPTDIIAFILFGIFCLWGGSAISKDKRFKTWKKQLAQNGAEEQIRTSVSAAIEAYKAFPGNKTLKYIRSLNPDAAQIISDRLAAAKAERKAKK